MQSGEPLATTLALGALAGALLELALLLWRSRPLLGTLRPSLDHLNAHLREAARRLPNVLLGRGVIQISGLVDTLMVSFVGTGANATFAYAQMLYLLPMSLLGTGEAAVSLPEMARDSAEQDAAERHRRMRRRLSVTLTRVTALSIPATVVLSLFGVELVSLLLKTGEFDRDSTLRVAEALRIYGIALLANASVRLYATTFFALSDTKLPARYAVVRVIASTAIALALLEPLGVVGVVTGAVSAGWIEAVLLGRALSKRIDGLGLRDMPLGKLAVLAAVTAGLPWLARRAMPDAFAESLLGVTAILAIVGAVFVLASTMLGVIDFRRLRSLGGS